MTHITIEAVKAPYFSHIKMTKECSKTEHLNIIESVSPYLEEMSIERVRDGYNLTGQGENYVIKITPNLIEICCIPDLSLNSIEAIVQNSDTKIGLSLGEFKIKQLGFKVHLVTNLSDVKATIDKLATCFDKEKSGYCERLYRLGKPALFFNREYPFSFYRNSDKQLNIYVYQSKILSYCNLSPLDLELSYFRRFPARIRDKSISYFIENINIFRKELTFQLYQSYNELRKRSMNYSTISDDDYRFYAALDFEFQRLNELYGW